MNPAAEMKATIARLSNAQLVAIFTKIDRAIVTSRQNPAEFQVRLAVCDELDARGMSHVYCGM